MTSKSLTAPFVATLIALPLAFAAAVLVGGAPGASTVTKALFAMTLVVEVVALFQALSARKLFSPADSGHLTWTLIVAFLLVRITAETRLFTLNFNLVTQPERIEDASTPLFFYIVVLRYLYTLSDLLFVCALATTIRTYKSTGLRFEMLKRDYGYILALMAMPVTAFVFRDNLMYSDATGTNRHIATFRLVTVGVCALVVSLCLAVRRYALQMGGGAVARTWSTVVVAGLARGASFLALALLMRWWRPGAMFFEQYLLWIFSGLWLLAALYQQEVLPQATRSPVAVSATA
jgi:hypothetical protein